MSASIESTQLQRFVITKDGEVREQEYGDWADAIDAAKLVSDLQDLCRKYKAIAGACLSGTDEVERIAAESPTPQEAWSKAFGIHRERDEAAMKSLRAVIEGKSSG